MATNQAQKLMIWNMAANKISTAAIKDLTEDSEAAKSCRAVYDNLKREFLEYHGWNWATSEVALTELKEANGFRLYFLPQDFVYALRLHVYDRHGKLYPHPVEFSIETTKYNGDNLRVIKTRAKEANLVYVLDVEESLFSAHFTTALATNLAAEISRAVNNDLQMYQALRQEALTLLGMAKNMDLAEERRVEFMPRDRKYVRARYGFRHHRRHRYHG